MSNWVVQICCKDGNVAHSEIEAKDGREVVEKLEIEKGNDYIYLVDKDGDFVFIPKTEILRINIVKMKSTSKKLIIKGFNDED